jgi:hypothetical protein
MVALVAPALNDAGRWAYATNDLHNSTKQALDSVAQSSKGTSTDAIREQLAAQAAERRIRVVEYLIVPDESVHIWTEEDVSGTWLLGAALALSKGVPINKAYSTTPTVQFDAIETIR